MESADSVQLTKVMLLLVLLLLCSVSDLRTRRIPNDILLATFVTALFLNGYAEGVAGILDSVLGLFAGMLLLLPLHVLGRMGAGDVKLLGVVGSVLGAWGAIVAGFATMIAGGVLGILYILWLTVRPALLGRVGILTGRTVSANAPVTGAARSAEFPYAIAIAAGSFAALVYLDLLEGIRVS